MMGLPIELDDLKQMLRESYEKGWRGSLDLCDSVVDEIIGKLDLDAQPKKCEAERLSQLYLFGDEPTYTTASTWGDGSTFTIDIQSTPNDEVQFLGEVVDLNNPNGGQT